ncbi:acyl-CoA dehydrogenase family protein [Halioxenophilus sp. WMMB6]|uniref:acyl-CoA dehydrogenase family protein n=1 Tax=Halioxenophilus sp. WMMB6 TaxID=3073815 RepID=UPI00295F2381|nr:acyl-CoA dehydrogenase family protein [Halioxenophilus sp. WMMB6]
MFKRDFTAEQEAFREAYRRFLQVEVTPHMESWREQGIVARDLFKKAGDNGFLLTWADEEYGGLGDPDFRFEQIMIEENQYALTSDWYTTLHSRLVGPYIQRFGNSDQKQKYLPKCVSGESILAIAMTEPDAGSDLAGMRTTALEQEDHYLLNGSKTYISNGINADLVVVAAKIDPVNKPREISLFLVERGMAGFERGANLKKMGKKAQDTAELFFSNVKIPKENLLGTKGKGLSHLMEALAEERLIAAVEALSAAQKAFDLADQFCRERKLFGQRLADFQNTQFKLAELRAELDIQQVYVDQCVKALNLDQLTPEDAAKAKLATTETLGRMVDEAVQLHGGAGYMDEYPISRMYTDARVTRIYAGSSEVMKLIISRDIFRKEFVPYIDKP